MEFSSGTFTGSIIIGISHIYANYSQTSSPRSHSIIKLTRMYVQYVLTSFAFLRICTLIPCLKQLTMFLSILESSINHWCDRREGHHHDILLPLSSSNVYPITGVYYLYYSSSRITIVYSIRGSVGSGHDLLECRNVGSDLGCVILFIFHLKLISEPISFILMLVSHAMGCMVSTPNLVAGGRLVRLNSRKSYAERVEGLL